MRTESEFVDYDEPFYPDPNDRSSYLVGTWIQRFSQHYALLSDTTIYHLDIDDPAAEVRETKRQMREIYN